MTDDEATPPRLPLVSVTPDDPQLAATFADVQAAIDRIPNLYRVLGHAPALLDAWLAFAWPLRHEATTDRRLRELIIMRTAQLDGADYEWRQHWVMATEAGVSEAQLRALADWPAAPDFDDVERAALRMTDELAVSAAVSDETWGELSSHFDEAACVELVLTASFYACVSRVLGGLQVPLEAGTAATTPPVPPVNRPTPP